MTQQIDIRTGKYTAPEDGHGNEEGFEITAYAPWPDSGAQCHVQLETPAPGIKPWWPGSIVYCPNLPQYVAVDFGTSMGFSQELCAHHAAELIAAHQHYTYST